MGLLTRYLKSQVTEVENANLTDEQILKVWKEYISTIKRKGEIIIAITTSNANSFIEELRKLVDIGLIDISKEGNLEEELIVNIKNLEHSEKIRRVERLEQCLGYIESQYEYMHGLIIHFHSVLRSELASVNNLDKNPKKEIINLKELYQWELKLLEKMNSFTKNRTVETFHEVFASLITGERLIKMLNDNEKKLFKRMNLVLGKVFTTDDSAQRNKGPLYRWVDEVVNAIEDKIHELEAQGILGYNQDIDFEFVNRPEFIDLVRKKAPKIDKKVSEEKINMFVYIFREWYNHR